MCFPNHGKKGITNRSSDNFRTSLRCIKAWCVDLFAKMVQEMRDRVNFNIRENCYCIAEIGMSHDGSFGLAKNLTEAAIESGANIVKYQWHLANAKTLKNAPAPSYFTNESRYEYFTRTGFSEKQFRGLVELCHKNNVWACISVFLLESVGK